MCAAIERRRDDLVELASALIRFDTTARNVGDLPRDEAALQRWLADRLVAAGAGIHLWEAEEMAGRPLVPPGLDYEGRPQLVARFAGGAVNAIEKATVVIDAMRGLRAAWSTREGLDHAHLSRPDLLPTLATAGEWAVTYPAGCDLTIAVLYLPGQADGEGWGSAVRREVEECLARETARDDWLAEHRPEIEWWPNGVMPMEIPESEPIVGLTLDATRDVGAPGRPSGLDSWYDGATFTLLAGIPSVAYGPSGLRAGGLSVAHTIDEHVPVDDLVTCAQGLAVAAMRFCGTG